VGLLSIWLEACWEQFAGLHERLTGCNPAVCRQIEAAAAQVLNLGMIGSPEKAVAAGHTFRQANVNLLFLHVSTYVLSSAMCPVVRWLRAPVILLNLSP